MEPGLFGQINRPQDLDNLNDLEKKHTPIIDCPDSVTANEPFEVTVHVGKLLKHPNEVGHHLQWIEVYNGDLLLARVDLTPVSSEPKVTFAITLESTADVRALARCNLHGTWENAKHVNIS